MTVEASRNFLTGLLNRSRSLTSKVAITAGLIGLTLASAALSRTKSVSSALLQPLPTKNAFGPCIGDATPGYNFLMLHSSQHPAWTELSAEDLEKDLDPLLCDHVVFHGADVAYMKKHEKLVRHQVEWAENFPKDCLLSLGPTCRPAARIRGSVELANTRRYEPKLYATQYVQDLIQRKRITTHNGSVPWTMFTDVDFLFANKYKGVESVINRLKSGFSHGHNATRPYYTSEDILFNSVMGANRTLPANPPKFDSMAFALASDQGGRTRWLYNSGAYIYKPSTVASFIFDSVVYLFNHTAFTLDPEFAFTGDQGALSMVLRDGFDFVSDFHHQMKSAQEQDLKSPCQGNELMAVHRINLTRLFSNPIFSEVAGRWFPHGMVPPGEPDSVALVCSRWFNAPACKWAIEKQFRESQKFECDDFAAHFNGCSKYAYGSEFFRELFKGKDNCKESFSFKTNVDGSPFSWEQWTKDVGAIAVH